MSGIVGSRLNIRGSGLVGSLGTDGQVLTSSGAGVGAVYEAAAGGMSVSDITGATALEATPAATDELILSDAGTLKRIDYTHIRGNNAPYFLGTSPDPQDFTYDTYTKLNLTIAYLDSDSAFDTTNKRWTVPAGEDGVYNVGYSVEFESPSANKIRDAMCFPYKNGALWPFHGSDLNPSAYFFLRGANQRLFQVSNSFLGSLDAGDYIEMYVNGANIDGAGTTLRICDFGTTFWGFKVHSE